MATTNGKIIIDERPNFFNVLNNVNVNDHTEQKNGLTYLSWAWAWAEIKKVDPLANYTIYENAEGWNYHTDRATAWVKVGVTVGGLEHIEYLPVMDYKNRSIPFDSLTSMDVNKAIQRALTKACARHGLGLYIYAGEDLPEEDKSKARDLATAKDALQTFCMKFGEDVAPKVWKKYKVDEITDPEKIYSILENYKAKIAEKEGNK